VSHVSQKISELSVLQGGWSLVPHTSEVEFHTKIMRLVPVRGTIKAIAGSAYVGPDGSIEGTLILDATTIDTGIKKRDVHLRTADFFDADNHPMIAFAADSVRRYPSGRFEVAGTLTLHGQTRSLTTFVEIRHDAIEAVVSASIQLDRTEWGVGPTRFGPSNIVGVSVTARFIRE
jgi:polyisoprenoid-binding protein YceI